MIKIIIKMDKDKIININISGHANYNEYGKDIVCASISSIAISTINGILSIDNEAITYSENGNLVINNIKKDDITNKLLNNMINMFNELQKDYPKNISIRKEES